MSQAGIISTASGPVPPSVPTSFVTNSGTAVPAANVLNVLGDDTTANNVNGISTSGSGSTETILLTNRLQGTTSTVGAANGDVITFSLGATPSSYKFFFNLTGFDAITPSCGGYAIDATARTTGAAATVIQTPDGDEDEDVAFANADWTVVASGNNIILRVTGVAGLTISWSAVGYYVVAS